MRKELVDGKMKRSFLQVVEGVSFRNGSTSFETPSSAKEATQ